jgi:4-oxalomesaconate tautomerase
LGAVSVATAVAIPGTVGAELLRRDPSGSVTLEHPTGSFQTVVELDVDDDGNVAVGRAGIVRTARKLMDGLVFPRPYD